MKGSGTCALLAAFLLNLAPSSCAPGDNLPSPGHGNLALSLHAVGGSGTESLAFRLRLYDGSPQTPDVTPAYDSACQPYASSVLLLRNMPTSDQYSAYYEGFGDAQCATKPIVRGMRGGISIAAGDTGEQGYYYIQVYAVGRFVELPTPSQALLQELASLTVSKPCQRDSDCWVCNPDDACNPCQDGAACAPPACCGNRADGYCCTGHPQAQCDPDRGVCTLDTLFPLNLSSPRAFHSSIALPDGHIVFSGGFATSDPQQPDLLLAGEQQTEWWDPRTGLFRKVAANADQERQAMHVGAAVGEHRIALVGGLHSARFTLQDNALSIDVPNDWCPADGSTCADNFVRGLWIVDLENTQPDSEDANLLIAESQYDGSLAAALAFHQATWIAQGSGFLLISGGSEATGSQISISSRVYTCDVNGLTSACEKSANGLVSPRATHSGVCLESAGVGCSDYLVLGGIGDHSGSRFAERFDAVVKQFRAAGMQAGAVSPRSLFIQAARLGTPSENIAGLILHGGAPEGSGIADQDAVFLGYDTSTDTVTSTLLEPTGTAQEPSVRLHNRMVTLLDGRAMSVGGLDGAGVVQARALLFSRGSGAVPNVDVLNMNRARLGHDVAVIQSGLLRGAVLVSGGITFSNGHPSFVRGAEVFLPE